MTGGDLLTSFGIGKSDNWARLVAGEPGICQITCFPLDGLKTTAAGTIDFPAEPFSSVGLSKCIAELARKRGRGRNGHGARFPRPSTLVWPLSSWNGASTQSLDAQPAGRTKLTMTF